MKWVGPAFIVLGMIYGAVYLVETDMFGPPERLVAGIAVTLGFGWLGQYFIRRGQRLLGELVTGTFFAGAFLCSWAVPAVTDWPIGTSILLSGAVGLLALAYSWVRNDSTSFAVGVVGLAGIPISGPLYSDFKFLETVEDIYGEPEMIAPLVLFAVLAFGLRVTKGWFLPWALTNMALFLSFGFVIDHTFRVSERLATSVLLVAVIATSSLLGVVRGEVDDVSPLQKHLDPLFRLIDAAAPILALLPVLILVDDLDFARTGERLAMGVWAAGAVGLALSVYRGIDSWGIQRAPGRRIGAYISAFLALLIAIGNLNWYVYVVVLAAAFVISVVAGSNVDETANNAAEPEASPGKDGTAPKSTATAVVDVIQALLGSATAIGLLFMIMSGLSGPLADDVPTLLSAWSAAALFAAGFYLRPELRNLWGVPYALSLGLLASSLGGEPVTLMITSAAWLLVGFAAVKFGLARSHRTAVVIGLSTIAIAVGKFLLVDTPQFDSNLMRAISFLVAGLVIVLISADSSEIRGIVRAKGD